MSPPGTPPAPREQGGRRVGRVQVSLSCPPSACRDCPRWRSDPAWPPKEPRRWLRKASLSVSPAPPSGQPPPTAAWKKSTRVSWGAWPGGVGQAGHWGVGGMGGIGLCSALIKLSELHLLLLPAVPWAPLPPREPGCHVPSVPCVTWCSLSPNIPQGPLIVGAPAGCTPQQWGGGDSVFPGACCLSVCSAAGCTLLSRVPWCKSCRFSVSCLLLCPAAAGARRASSSACCASASSPAACLVACCPW